jgi:hypothetical protein
MYKLDQTRARHMCINVQLHMNHNHLAKNDHERNSEVMRLRTSLVEATEAQWIYEMTLL